MTHVLAGLAWGALLGGVLGGVLWGATLVEALGVVAREQWWSQGMTRLAAEALAESIRLLSACTLGGAVLGAALAAWRRSAARSSSSWLRRLGLGLGATLVLISVAAEVTRNRIAKSADGAPPHVVWIVLDALRADHLGSYGYQHDTSPFLDELAARATRFDFAVSQESYTLASAASYFTSTYPPLHGVLYDEPQLDTLDSSMLTVAEVLSNRGYATAAFVFNPHLQARYKFGQGFDVYDDGVTKSQDPEPHVHDVFDTAERMHTKVEHYLSQRAASGDERPAALYLHYRDIHGPYVPPPPYHDMFAPDTWTAAQRQFALRGTCRPLSEAPAPFVEDLGYRHAQYDGEIRYTDDALVRLFELLSEHNIDLSNTVVIVTADHGEEFHDPHPEDQKGWTHGRTLYVEQVRVPLIISVPDQVREGPTGSGAGLEPGLVIGTPVELLDLGPTIVELAGCAADETPPSFQGRSLLPLMRGGSRPDRPVFSGGNHGRGLVMAGGLAYYAYDQNTKTLARRHSLRPDENYEADRRAQLFDMRVDPAQARDILSEDPGSAEQLDALLLQWLSEASDHMQTQRVELDDETTEQLKALGYLGGSDGD